jgi:hypothetical protein
VIVHSTNDIEVIDRRYDHMIFQVVKKEKMVGIADLNASVREILP